MLVDVERAVQVARMRVDVERAVQVARQGREARFAKRNEGTVRFPLEAMDLDVVDETAGPGRSVVELDVVIEAAVHGDIEDGLDLRPCRR